MCDQIQSLSDPLTELYCVSVIESRQWSITLRDDLERVRDLAKQKLQGGSEPPWAWYQYMKLVETCDAILSGMDATTSSPQSVNSQGVHLRLVDSADLPDNVQPRSTGLSVS